MIFYFTGTGNTLYLAERISEVCGDKPLPMHRFLESGEMSFALQSGERLGLAFPVHCWGTPPMVDEFISKMEITSLDEYGEPREGMRGIFTFAVMTYGSSEGLAPRQIERNLADRDIQLDYCSAVRMPDNYVIGADTSSDEKVSRILTEADSTIDGICLDIMYRRHADRTRKPLVPIVQAYANKVFKKYGRKTSEFHVDPSCSSCGLCARICPSSCIEMDEDGLPRWTAESCAYCLACVNRCPMRAIQNGQTTSHRSRYHHPILDISDVDSDEY